MRAISLKIHLALGVQKLQRRGVDAWIAGREALSALGAGTALPVGDDAARTLDHRNKRGHVPAVERRFDDEIGKAERHGTEDVAVAAPARHFHRALHAPERLALAGLEVAVGMRGAENGVREIGAGTNLERQRGAAKVKFGRAVGADEALADPGLIDDAEHRAPIPLQSNE